MAGKPTVILVAGYDYVAADTRQRQLDRRPRVLDMRTRFLQMCKVRTKQLFDPGLDFILFDFCQSKVHIGADRNGEYKLHEVHPVQVKFPGDYKVFPKPEDYPRLELNRGLLSIDDVYERIRRFESGRIVRFEIFSHGYSGGPILYNSFERPLYDWAHDLGPPIRFKYENRDPLDTDGRSRKDFNENMGFSATPFNKNGRVMSRLEAFKDSFAKDAEIRVWGCSREGLNYRELLDQTSDILKDHQRDRRPVDMTIKRKFSIHVAQPVGPPVLEDRFYSLAEITATLKEDLGISYGGRICAVTGATCYTALPGTYSTYESSVEMYSAEGFRLMRVPVLEEQKDEDAAADDHSRRIQVYEELIPGLVVNIRHYAILTPSFMKSSGIEKATLDMIERERAVLT